jgi:hypothetical protein
MSNYDDLQPDLQPVIDMLEANRPQATALELDAVKQRVRSRVSRPARRRTRRAQLMKSRLVILTMLVLGMCFSTAGAGLAITGLAGNNNASVAAYPGARVTPQGGGGGGGGGGGVLGEEDQGAGNNVSPEESGGGTNPSESGGGTQPSRQVEAGAETGGNELPFTGFAAIPILFGGLVLLGSGLVLRRRSAADES